MVEEEEQVGCRLCCWSREKKQREKPHQKRFQAFWEHKLADLLKKKKMKNSWKEEFVVVTSSEEEQKVFQVLLQLYAHQEQVVEQLYELQPRQFEFYIPQLCTFLLHAQYSRSVQLECFLLAQCCESLQFAHRLYWFFTSFCCTEETLATSNHLMYSSEGLSATQSNSEKSEQTSFVSSIEIQGGIPATLIEQGIPPNATRLHMNSIENIGSSEKLTYYYETIRFCSNLTDLADYLMEVEQPSRNAHLREQLLKFPKFTSPVCYLPIGGYGRTFPVIKKIHVEESFAFNTKERVPYLICVEVIDSNCTEEDTVELSCQGKIPETNVEKEDEVDMDHYTADHQLLGKKIEKKIHPIRIKGKTLPGATTPAVSDDENDCQIFNELWSEKEKRIGLTSEFANLKGWKLVPVIIKSNDDLRQEQFAAQLLLQCQSILKPNKELWIRSYDILATSSHSGLIEAVPDTISLDSLKKKDPLYTTLRDFFVRQFGPETSAAFLEAQQNFISSCASYGMICFLLQIKDRHNGNLLIDAAGHLLHIDFGFFLSNSPGRNFNFESAPFKLTNEFVEVMGGDDSAGFLQFRKLCADAYILLRQHRSKIVLLVEMMLQCDTRLPCLTGGGRFQSEQDTQQMMEELMGRFNPDMNQSECIDFVNGLVDKSMKNWRTKWYDSYQQIALGIRK